MECKAVARVLGSPLCVHLGRYLPVCERSSQTSLLKGGNWFRSQFAGTARKKIAQEETGLQVQIGKPLPSICRLDPQNKQASTAPLLQGRNRFRNGFAGADRKTFAVNLPSGSAKQTGFSSTPPSRKEQVPKRVCRCR